MALGVSVTIDKGLYQSAVRAWPIATRVRVSEAVHETAWKMADAMRSHASGRPGPRVQTGNLRGSILVDHEIGDVDGWGVATVYTDTIYARRLEYGFYGVDSLGRVGNQPPYPFWGPGFNQVAPTLEDRVRQALTML